MGARAILDRAEGEESGSEQIYITCNRPLKHARGDWRLGAVRLATVLSWPLGSSAVGEVRKLDCDRKPLRIILEICLTQNSIINGGSSSTCYRQFSMRFGQAPRTLHADSI